VTAAKLPLIRNRLFDTCPMLVHAAGKAEHLPVWPAVLEAAAHWRIDAQLDPTLTVVRQRRYSESRVQAARSDVVAARRNTVT